MPDECEPDAESDEVFDETREPRTAVKVIAVIALVAMVLVTTPILIVLLF